MQTITISGNLGKDAALRQTQSGEDVLGFSVGVKQGWGDKASTNWFRCNVWGKRAKTLEAFLFKGVKVVVQGELQIGSYEGKPQFDIRVNEVEFMSRAEQNGVSRDSQRSSGPSQADLDDDVPF